MDNKFRLIFGVILVGLILSYIAWDNAKKNRKLERHYAEYPKIDKSLSFNGRIVSIFGDWEAMKVHEMSMDVSIKLDSESISMSATSDGTFTGEGIGHFISIGDSIYKEVSNDTVWVKKAYSKDLLPFVLVRN